MEKHKIDRINELAKKLKAQGLTEAEHLERKALHREYVEEFKNGLKHTLENTYIQRPDGTKEKVKKKKWHNISVIN